MGVYYLFCLAQADKILIAFKLTHSSHESQTSDSRYFQIMAIAHQEAQASGYCYSGPLLKGFHKEAIDPDKEKCDAIYKAASDNCNSFAL